MKRRWFQIHLSTAVVMMLLAGSMMWANFHVKISKYEMTFGFVEVGKTSVAYDQSCIGWPFVMVQRIPELDYEQFSVSSLALNVCFACSLVFLVAISCEQHIRRREARKR